MESASPAHRPPSVASTSHQDGDLSYVKVPMNKAIEIVSSKMRSKPRFSSSFRRFTENDTCAHLLESMATYFESMLRADDAVAGVRARTVTESEALSLEEIVEEQLQGVARAYSVILMTETKIHQLQQDNKFFETLYEFANEVLVTIFGEQCRMLVEEECGRIFRTDSFNLTRRANEESRKPFQTFTSKQLYLLRYHGDPVNNAKIIALLHPRKRASDSVNRAVRSRTPLVSTIVSSPSSHPDTERRRLIHEAAAAAAASGANDDTKNDVGHPHALDVSQDYVPMAGGGGGGGNSSATPNTRLRQASVSQATAFAMSSSSSSSSAGGVKLPVPGSPVKMGRSASFVEEEEDKASADE